MAAATPPRGVHIDPGSPAGKQYAIPLAQARSAGAPAHVSATGSAQLFGAGITPHGPSATTHATAAARGPSGRRTAPSPAAGKPAATKSVVKITPVRKLLGSGPGESSGVWWMLAAGALVLVLGGLGGAVLARRS